MHQADPDFYWSWGRRAAERVAASIDHVPQRLLVLPCGHGRELRWLRAAYPEAAITACDLDQDGVEFCAATFPDVTGVVSDEDPQRVELDGGYDAIWVGSLLTHLDGHRWPGFLDLFSRSLARDGRVIFTTHGPRVAKNLRAGRDLGLGDVDLQRVLAAHDRTGFGYADYPGQDRYGISLSSARWVTERIEDTQGLELVRHVRRGWGAWHWHHAAWVCRSAR